MCLKLEHNEESIYTSGLAHELAYQAVSASSPNLHWVQNSDFYITMM